MKQIAEELNISKAAVSLALRGQEGVSKETRSKVNQLAARLNYQPDPAIASTVSTRWNQGNEDRHTAIAFLCIRNSPFHVFQKAYLRGVKERASELGYSVDVLMVENSQKEDAVSRIIQARGIRMLIIPPLPDIQCLNQIRLKWSEFTVVCCGIGRVHPALHTVTDNTFDNTRLLWETAFAAGFRRIGAALHMHQPADEDDWNRIGASYAAQEMLGIPDKDRIPLMLGSFEDDDALHRWFRKYKPEIIIGFNNYTADRLQKKGVRFPQDAQFVALMTSHGLPWSGFVRPFNTIGRSAVDLLIAEVRENHRGLGGQPGITLISPEWNKGTSFFNKNLALTSTP